MLQDVGPQKSPASALKIHHLWLEVCPHIFCYALYFVHFTKVMTQLISIKFLGYIYTIFDHTSEKTMPFVILNLTT